MDLSDTLRAASGWLELGLPSDALEELGQLPGHQQSDPQVLELKLQAQMGSGTWNAAADTARVLCALQPGNPAFFLHAAYCLHETGDTLAARNQLLRGPKSLFSLAHFHYNIACYHWVLGEQAQARTHLRRAIAMDSTLREHALTDRDLAGMGPLT